MRSRRWLTSFMLLGTLLFARPAGAWSAPELAWSPDGRWLAMVQLLDDSLPARGWVWRPEEGDPEADSTRAVVPRWQLWLLPRSAGQPQLAAESARPLGGPAWHPSQAGLVYLRGHSTSQSWELVWQATARPARVVATFPAPDAAFDRSLSWQQLDVAWSHDGQLCAVVLPHALHVLSWPAAETLAIWPHARAPAWSSESATLIAYRGGERPALVLSEPPFREPRLLLDTESQPQAPLWDPPQGLLAIRTRRQPRNERGDLSWREDLVRLPLPQGAVEVLQPLREADLILTVPPPPVWFVRGVNPGELWLIPQIQEGFPYWRKYALEKRSVAQIPAPLDLLWPVQGLVPSPEGRQWALRCGPEPGPHVCLIAGPDEEFEPELVAGPGAATLAQLAMLARTSARLLATDLASSAPVATGFRLGPAQAAPPVFRWPVLPPISYDHKKIEEIARSARSRERLVTLSRWARQALAASSKELSSPALLQIHAELSWYFAVLERDWPAAQQAWQALADAPLPPEERLRWLAARAMLLQVTDRTQSAQAQLADVRARVALWTDQELNLTQRQRLEKLRHGLDWLRSEWETRDPERPALEFGRRLE